MRTPAKRIALMWLIGSLLLQLAWISALPPFAGVDEFDHAYRASAVAHGQITTDHVAATDGRGELVVVDRSIAEAARAQCEARTYTGPDNCRPVADAGPGLVTIASAAASYNPAFYFVVGHLAKPFDGADALYVMRLVTAVLCSLFLALAAWLTCLWARTRWPLVGLMVASTPVLVYSTSIASPNGLEMCAALSVWVALLGFREQRPRDASRASAAGRDAPGHSWWQRSGPGSCPASPHVATRWRSSEYAQRWQHPRIRRHWSSSIPVLLATLRPPSRMWPGS